MKILWFTNVLMPEFAQALGLSAGNGGGWMGALLDALRVVEPNMELAIVCGGNRHIELNIRGVSYVMLRNVRVESKGIVQNFSPDVIHIHGSEVIAQELPDEILSDARVLLSLQGIIYGYYPFYNGNIAPFELRGDRNWLKMILRHSSVYLDQKRWEYERAVREQHILKLVKHVAGRTDWDKAWAGYLNPKVQYFKVGEVLRKPFYNGMRSRSAIRPHTIYCSAAMTYPLKGGHWLLRAVKALKQTYPDVQLRVAAAKRVEKPRTLVGKLKWSDYHHYLNRVIRELGLEKNVALLGNLSAQEVYDELSCAEVFCLPSLIENSPNSLGEAQLVGVPCVATDVGGTRSMLTDGRDGLLVPSADPASLAQAISKIFSSPALSVGMVENAYSAAKMRHDPNSVVNELCTSYRIIGAK